MSDKVCEQCYDAARTADCEPEPEDDRIDWYSRTETAPLAFFDDEGNRIA